MDITFAPFYVAAFCELCVRVFRVTDDAIARWLGRAISPFHDINHNLAFAFSQGTYLSIASP